MKKTAAALFLTAALMIVSSLSALALISSPSELNSKAFTLGRLSNYDILSLVNKSDLVGERLNNFKMLTARYQNDVIQAKESILGFYDQAESVNRLADISNAEKELQMSRIYQDADAILYDIDSKSINYLYALKNFMPTVTYSKFVKKFSNFYNELHITNREVKLK